MNFTQTYYASFDPGSAHAGLKLMKANGVPLAVNSLTIESCIATGNSDELLNRGDIDAQLADVIRQGESLVTLAGSDYYLQGLTREGRNATYALGNPARYWSDHARVLLLALASQLIPERVFTLRLVTALPVSLYNRENRARMKEALSGTYHYSYNGISREAHIVVGYVAMEGQGVQISAGRSTGLQAVIDIGERTSDFVVADGQKLIISQCAGNHELGVGLIVDALDSFFRRHNRVIKTSTIHNLLNSYAHGLTCAHVEDAQGNIISDNDIIATIEKARASLTKSIISFAGSIWNVEGEAVGQQFERMTVAGGGAYYVGSLLVSALPHVHVPDHPEDSNLYGYLDLALSLEDKVASIWEEVA